MNIIEGGIVLINGVELLLESGVKKKQVQDTILLDLKASVHNQRVLAFEQVGDGVLNYQGILCGDRVDGIQERILEEVHSSRYSIHSGSTKMYCDLREVYFWECMKKYIAEFLPSAQIVSK